MIKCTDVSLGAVGNSSIKTDLERQIRQQGGEMSNPAWILMGKEQILVPTEEVGMLWEGEVPAGVEVGMGCGLDFSCSTRKIRFRWEDVGEDPLSWERGNFQDVMEYWCSGTAKGTLRWAAQGAGTNLPPSAFSSLKNDFHSFLLIFFPRSALPSRAGYF